RRCRRPTRCRAAWPRMVAEHRHSQRRRRESQLQERESGAGADRPLSPLDARYRMNLVPLLVILFPHERPRDRHMGADRWNGRVVGEPDAGGLGIRLRDLVVADDLEHEIAAFVRSVPGVDEIGELRIDLQPAVRVTVALMPNAVRLMMRLILGCVDDLARYRDAVLQYDQPRRMVYVLPQAVATPGHARRPVDAGAKLNRLRGRGRRGAHSHVATPHIAFRSNARLHVVVAAL